MSKLPKLVVKRMKQKTKEKSIGFKGFILQTFGRQKCLVELFQSSC